MNDLKKYFIISAIFCLAAAQSFPQELKLSDRKPGLFFTQNETTIHLTDNEINIGGESGRQFKKEISGKKIFHFSPSKKYLLVCNFNFPKGKENYSISIFLFDENYELKREENLEAFYDMPHQIFAVNDEGIISAYDPASMELTLLKNESTEKILLEEKINYEMERAAFMQMTNSNLFIATNLQPVVMENNQPNCAVYKIDLSDNSFVKITTDLSVVTSLNLNSNNLFLSGVKFTDSAPAEKTLQFNLNFESISVFPFQINYVINVAGSFYGRTNQKIFALSEQPLEVGNFEVLGNLLSYAPAKDFSTFFLLEKDGRYALAGLNYQTENSFEINLLSTYFETDFIQGFINDNKIYYLFTNTQTYIIQ